MIQLIPCLYDSFLMFSLCVWNLFMKSAIREKARSDGWYDFMIYAGNEPKSYSWYDLGDCRDSHNKHALRVYYGWIFLRLFIYVMVASATVRYGTSVSHISLPQTSVSVDSWGVKEKSKNYHNWTSSASHDVCAAPIFTYIMSGCGLIYEKWMCG